MKKGKKIEKEKRKRMKKGKRIEKKRKLKRVSFMVKLQ
jgi:hypothetical protein